MGMNIAVGAQKVQEDAAALDISAQDKVQAERSNAGSFGGRASAVASGAPARLAAVQAARALGERGVSNSGKGVPCRNATALRLGEQIGSEVMGPVAWATYITTSLRDMTQGEKPLSFPKAQRLAAGRESGERDGWVFQHAALSVPRWAMTDEITYTLPDHTEDNPSFYRESLQAAISKHTTPRGVDS